MTIQDLMRDLNKRIGFRDADVIDPDFIGAGTDKVICYAVQETFLSASGTGPEFLRIVVGQNDAWFALHEKAAIPLIKDVQTIDELEEILLAEVAIRCALQASK